jgi:beta-N-acetylhexosaminidase
MPESPKAAGKDRNKSSLEQAGALLLIGWPGIDVSELVSLLDEFKPAGFIYFRRNWPGSLDALRNTIGHVDSLAQKELGRPLLWAIDQEGGTVQRLDQEGLSLPSAMELEALALERGLESVSEMTYQAGKALKSLGFNLNLAPVLDVRGAGSYISSRSFSGSPARVAEVAASYAAGFERAGMLLCGKHFPGLGSSVVDPHKDLPLVPSTIQELWAQDGLPFREMIRQGIPAVMTTHALYRSLDPHLPPTLSKTVVDLLKKDYEFKGLTITDDLEMGGILTMADTGAAAVRSIVAGHDLAIVSKSEYWIRSSRDALAVAIEGGILAPARLRDARARLKKTLKLLT